MDITLAKPITKDPITKAHVTHFIDYPDQKEVHAFVDIKPGEAIVLWSGPTYDAVGQYTDADVQKRVADILNA